jgi:hypothetical protein
MTSWLESIHQRVLIRMTWGWRLGEVTWRVCLRFHKHYTNREQREKRRRMRERKNDDSDGKEERKIHKDKRKSRKVFIYMEEEK